VKFYLLLLVVVSQIIAQNKIYKGISLTFKTDHIVVDTKVFLITPETQWGSPYSRSCDKPLLISDSSRIKEELQPGYCVKVNYRTTTHGDIVTRLVMEKRKSEVIVDTAVYNIYYNQLYSGIGLGMNVHPSIGSTILVEYLGLVGNSKFIQEPGISGFGVGVNIFWFKYRLNPKLIFDINTYLSFAGAESAGSANVKFEGRSTWITHAITVMRSFNRTIQDSSLSYTFVGIGPCITSVKGIEFDISDSRGVSRSMEAVFSDAFGIVPKIGFELTTKSFAMSPELAFVVPFGIITPKNNDSKVKNVYPFQMLISLNFYFKWPSA
jgi:hypothetical protein